MDIKNHLDIGWGFGVVFNTHATLEIHSKIYCQSSLHIIYHRFHLYGKIILMIYALNNVPFVRPIFFTINGHILLQFCNPTRFHLIASPT
jgi:hypothetical protein